MTFNSSKISLPQGSFGLLSLPAQKMSSTTTTTKITGYLLKKGRIIKSNLKKRYFELVGTNLYCYGSHAVAAKGISGAKSSDSLIGLKAAMIGTPERDSVVPIHLIMANGEQSIYYVYCPTLDESLAEAKKWTNAFVLLIPKKIKSGTLYVIRCS